MKTKLQEFIAQHNDWENILSNAPYCIKISRDVKFGKRLILFKYSQQDSDFSNDIVKECRGIILNEDTFEIVSYSYNKFFNFSEPNAASIDWKSAIVLEKIDGSLIKVVKDNDKLLISTNGCIDVFKCTLTPVVDCPFSNFGELFMHAVKCHAKKNGIDDNKAEEWFKSLISADYTYMFELVSPFNRIVIKYDDTKLYFHGLRNNTTLEEVPFVESHLISHFDIPKFFSLKSLDECLNAANQLSWDNEGYVVVDKDFNRVKIKSPAYVAIHRMANNGNLSIRRAVQVYMENETNELLTYFPEYKSVFDLIDTKYNECVAELTLTYDILMSFNFQTKKEQALWILSHAKHSGLIFGMLKDDSSAKSVLKSLYSRHLDSFINVLELNNNKSVNFSQ